jgi:hypothetical protein
MKQEQALALAPKTSAPVFDFSGGWKNEYQSTMDLVVNGGAVTGTYTSTVSGTGAKITGPVAGWVSGNLISFAVNWPNAAITAWVGHMVVEGSDNAIETLWQMTLPTANPSDPNELWESIFAGADRFTR